MNLLGWVFPSKFWSMIRTVLFACFSITRNMQISKYLRLCLEMTTVTKRLKSAYFNRITKLKQPRDTWNVIRSLSRWSRKANHEEKPFFSSGFFNLFFLFHRIWFNTVDSFWPTWPYFDSRWKRRQRTLFELRRKSSSTDGLPYWILRNSAKNLQNLAIYIFNESLRIGSVSLYIKASNISSILKYFRATHLCDYRPTSLLPIISKVLEKVVCHK